MKRNLPYYILATVLLAAFTAPAWADVKVSIHIANCTNKTFYPTVGYRTISHAHLEAKVIPPARNSRACKLGDMDGKSMGLKVFEGNTYKHHAQIYLAGINGTTLIFSKSLNNSQQYVWPNKNKTSMFQWSSNGKWDVNKWTYDSHDSSSVYSWETPWEAQAYIAGVHNDNNGTASADSKPCYRGTGPDHLTICVRVWGKPVHSDDDIVAYLVRIFPPASNAQHDKLPDCPSGVSGCA